MVDASSLITPRDSVVEWPITLSRPRIFLHFHGAKNDRSKSWRLLTTKPDLFARILTPSALFIMNGGVSKTRTRRSGLRLSKALQETLLAAVASAGAGMNVDNSLVWRR